MLHTTVFVLRVCASMRHSGSAAARAPGADSIAQDKRAHDKRAGVRFMAGEGASVRKGPVRRVTLANLLCRNRGFMGGNRDHTDIRRRSGKASRT